MLGIRQNSGKRITQVSKIRYKTERESADDDTFQRTQVDMTIPMREALDRIAKRKGIQKRAELIRMFLAAAIKKEERDESPKASVRSRPNDRSRGKRRAG